MKIGELAKRASLNASAIRYYEKTGLLSPPHRVGGQRRYSDDALDRVLLISFASEMGFSLSEIKIFLSGLRNGSPVGPRWKKLAQSKIQEVIKNMLREKRLKSLSEHLLDCRCVSLNACVRRLALSPRMRSLRRPRALANLRI
jgi:MerR family redox-sensitive transcriptional activator SoxR